MWYVDEALSVSFHNVNTSNDCVVVSLEYKFFNANVLSFSRVQMQYMALHVM
jgi:hypothetical protein